MSCPASGSLIKACDLNCRAQELCILRDQGSITPLQLQELVEIEVELEQILQEQKS